MTVGTPELDPYNAGCPSRRILDLIGGRWTVLIVGALSDGPMRFSDLQRRVDGISQKMLTQTLRALERDGLVSRVARLQVPVRVDYELTAAGVSLVGPLHALEQWSIDHYTGVAQSQQEYAGRE